MSEMPIRVAMCDDHDMVRNALAMVLDRESDIEIVGAVASGADLLDLMGEQPVDVAILDVRLQDESGVELAQRLRVNQPDCHIVMLTSFESDSALVNSYEAGVSAFLLKTGRADELVSAVRGAAMGLRLVNPAAVRDALNRIRATGAALLEKLDDTDRQILHLIAAGQSDKQIAETVFLSVQTVRNRVSRLLNRFGKDNRTQLAVFVARVLPETSD